MPAGLAARLTRLEAAEERREPELRAATIVAAYGSSWAAAWEIVLRADAACRRCAALGGDERERAICVARELGHEDPVATAEEYLARARRMGEEIAAGLSVEQSVQRRAAEFRQEMEASGG